MGKGPVPPEFDGGDNIEPVDLKKALEERYLAYALSTIMHRALPDVRDGLKPVHRRIMHAMRLLRLNPDQGFAKCARIVGEVMGKFHPHGDQSIYDALVRLAQDFAVRYPLVDGQGNFGNIDGDNAAAMRYTEARMTEVAIELLLEGITEDAVDFRPTYNEEDEEPVVLPGAFPNLLANGSSGIAVGMATSIPPHNAAELCTAALLLIDDPKVPIEALMSSDADDGLVQGPDFPTGGIIVDSRESILDAYETGRGGFRVRARWEKEDQGRGTWAIVVTEIPYQVQKARLIEKIAELLIARKLPLLEDVRDESAEDIRVVLVPKSRTVDPGLLMESLFKLTELESRFPLNMNVLIARQGAQRPVAEGRAAGMARPPQGRAGPPLAAPAGRDREAAGNPRRLPDRLSQHRRGDPHHPRGGRAEAGDDGALVADRQPGRGDPQHAAARACASSRNSRSARSSTGCRPRRRRSRRCWPPTPSSGRRSRWEVRSCARSSARQTELGKRRTTFADAPEHDDADIHHAMIEKEPVTVVVSEKGWLRAMKGHLTDLSLLTFKEGDSLKLAFHAQTTDKILVFTTGGKFYTIGADRLPGGRGHGEPIRIIVDMENDQDIVTAFVHDARRASCCSPRMRATASSCRRSEVVANTRKGKQVMNVRVARRSGALRDLVGRSCRDRRRKPQDAGLPARRGAGDGARQGRAAAEIQGWRRCSTSRPSTWRRA